MPSISKFIAKVRETGFIVDAPSCKRSLAVLTGNNIATVAESVGENLSTSTRYHKVQYV